MREIKAQNGDRLDEIVLKEYGTIDVFNEVLKANSHLLTKPILKETDSVYLPSIKIKEKIKEVKTLW